MARQMFDAAYVPAGAPPDCSVAAGYLHGGQATHGWSAADWETVKSWPEIQWLLPIRVASPDAGGHDAAVETVREAELLGCPRGVALALDVEQGMAEEAARTGFHRYWAEYVTGSGFVPMIYTSRSAQPILEPAVANLGMRWWIADWTGQPHEVPGADATQWTSPVIDPALAVDLSTVNDALALWPLGANTGGVPVPPALNAPVVAVVMSPHDGYWLVAADGGIFAFGGAMAFPHNTLPTKRLAAPIVGAATTAKGDGLTLVGADGGVFTFGHAPYHGSIPELLAHKG